MGAVSNMLAKLWLQWRAAPLLSSSSQSTPLLSCCMRPNCFPPVHSQGRTKVAAASKLSPWQAAKTKCSQLPVVEFQHVDKMVRSTRLHKVSEPLFRRNADKNAGLVLQPAMHASIRLKCLPQAGLGCESARLKPHLVLIVRGCAGNGDEAQGRRASS